MRPAVFYPHRGRSNRALFGVVTQDVGNGLPGGVEVATNPAVLVPAVLDAVHELDPQVRAAAAIGALRVLDELLFGVSRGDPVSYGIAIVVVLTVALAASLLPARRAAAVDPMVALKQD